MELESFAVLGKGAVEVCNVCTDSFTYNKCGGQLFNDQKQFNVIVRWDDTCYPPEEEE